jgi:peptidoglycan-N-acetylglucosamine deacetylase
MVAKTPALLKKLYYSLIWDFHKTRQEIFLTFDDGPHPDITPAILEILEKFHAKATFFSIGRNVEKYAEVYRQVLDKGHSVGNHTYSHLCGWKTKNREYYEDISLAGNLINSNLFRPPYGKIKISQLKHLRNHYHIIMWDVMPGDFESDLSPEKCLDITLKNVQNGSIVVFHDSEKSKDRVLYTLPKLLQYLSEKGYTFPAITEASFGGIQDK